MDSVSIVATPTMSSATARCGARDTNSIVHVLWRFFDNRKMTKSGCSRIHGVGCLPLLTVSMLLQVRSAIRRVFFASKFFFCSSSIHSHALLNFGEFTCFIDKSFVHSHNIPTICTSQPISVEAMMVGFSLRRRLPKPRSRWYFKSGCTRRNSCSTSSQHLDIRLRWGYLGWRHTIQRWIGVTAQSLSSKANSSKVTTFS